MKKEIFGNVVEGTKKCQNGGNCANFRERRDSNNMCHKTEMDVGSYNEIIFSMRDCNRHCGKCVAGFWVCIGEMK